MATKMKPQTCIHYFYNETPATWIHTHILKHMLSAAFPAQESHTLSKWPRIQYYAQVLMGMEKDGKLYHLYIWVTTLLHRFNWFPVYFSGKVMTRKGRERGGEGWYREDIKSKLTTAELPSLWLQTEQEKTEYRRQLDFVPSTANENLTCKAGLCWLMRVWCLSSWWTQSISELR